jgi:hypothetical protein
LEFDTQRISPPDEAAAAAVDDLRIGPHCIEVPIDSQRVRPGPHDYLRKSVQTPSPRAQVRVALDRVSA